MADSPLPKGLFTANGKLYGMCARCGSIVRMDKPIFGDIHFCLTEEEEQRREQERRRQP